jgi:putative ATPase
VNAPLLSRCKVFRLQALSRDELIELLRRAVDAPQGLGGSPTVEEEALEALATLAQGDARRALTALEVVADEVRSRGSLRVAAADVLASSGEKTLLYDKAGEEHYNVTSAFIKSLRGSDPDAAIYWLMRMVEAGDDPLFLLRRMMIFASEDIGNADPRALELTVAADAAFRRMGLPEGLYPLSQAALYLATAPKSNAVKCAWTEAREAVQTHGSLPVPPELRNGVTKLMRDEGYGQGYRYAHDEPEGYVPGACYLPSALEGERYYRPTERGYERTIAERLRRWRGEEPGAPPSPEEPPRGGPDPRAGRPRGSSA